MSMASTEDINFDNEDEEINPWLLMLSYENELWDDEGITPDLTVERLWNSCIRDYLDTEQKDYVLSTKLFDESQFTPLSEAEASMLAKMFCVSSPEHFPFDFSKADLTNLNFRHGLNLERLVFIDIDLTNSTFDKESSLSRIIVLGDLSMNDCEFNSKIHFYKTIVRRSLQAEYVMFNDDVDFSKSVVGGDFSMNNSTFKSEVDFTDMKIRDRIFFVNTVFKDSTFFNGIEFGEMPPLFYAAQIHEDTDFLDISWPKVGRGSSKESAGQYVRAYEALKRKMGEQRKFRTEHLFLQLEMQSQEIADGFFGSLPSRFFRLLSDYGWSYLRPIIVLISIWLFGLLDVSSGLDSCKLKNLSLSFSNLFPFFGLSRQLLPDETKALDKYPILELFAGFQMIVGTVLLFLLLLAFRNRFRMK